MNRRERRARSVGQRAELRRQLTDALGQEGWKREDGPIGFEYRHWNRGREWTVRGVKPRAAVAMAVLAGLAGFLMGKAT